MLFRVVLIILVRTNVVPSRKKLPCDQSWKTSIHLEAPGTLAPEACTRLLLVSSLSALGDLSWHSGIFEKAAGHQWHFDVGTVRISRAVLDPHPKTQPTLLKCFLGTFRAKLVFRGQASATTVMWYRRGSPFAPRSRRKSTDNDSQGSRFHH